jgi:chromosomal replication initiation ATPase DnaA
MLKIVHDIIERGFKGYEDFKDQLDAIDLGMVPDDIEQLQTKEGTDMLRNLFKLLAKEIN